MSKKKTHISKKKMAAVKKAAPKRKHKPYKVYEKHHTQEMEMLENRMPGAINAVEEAKKKMDKAIRNAKRRKDWKQSSEWSKWSEEARKKVKELIEKSHEGPLTKEEQAIIDKWRKERIWVPKRVLRQKELEQQAAYFEKDRKGKTRLQSGLDKIARLAALAETWEGGGYVTINQLEMMADKLGVDINEMMNYDLLQMSEAIHQFFETGITKEERYEFGYVETGRAGK